MKKSNKFFAIPLALTLAASMSIPAFAADVEATPGFGVLSGESTLENPVLQVTVPSSLNFALDPIDLDAAAGQVLATPYVLQNDTVYGEDDDPVPVLAAFYLDLDLADGIEIADADTLSDGDANYALDATAKELAFGIAAAASDATVVAADGTDPAEVDKWAETDVVYFAENENDIFEAQAGFIIADDETPTAFGFYAVANAYADWEANDVKVSGIYLLKALSATYALFE